MIDILFLAFFIILGVILLVIRTISNMFVQNDVYDSTLIAFGLFFICAFNGASKVGGDAYISSFDFIGDLILCGIIGLIIFLIFRWTLFLRKILGVITSIVLPVIFFICYRIESIYNKNFVLMSKKTGFIVLGCIIFCVLSIFIHKKGIDEVAVQRLERYNERGGRSRYEDWLSKRHSDNE